MLVIMSNNNGRQGGYACFGNECRFLSLYDLLYLDSDNHGNQTVITELRMVDNNNCHLSAHYITGAVAVYCYT